MPRLSQEIIEYLKTAILRGTSINKISHESHLAKSTIYYYYKKFKGKKYVIPSFTPGYTETEGELVGIFAGDGSQYFYKKTYRYEVNIHFGIKNKEYAIYVQKLFESFFHHAFRLRAEKNGRILRLRIESKIVYNYFKNYLNYLPNIKHSTVKLKNMDNPHKFKIGFLRGLIDTDGSVLYKKDRKKVRVDYTTTSKELALQMGFLFKEMNISYGSCVIRRPQKNEKDLYLIYILCVDTDKFLNMVKPFKWKNLRARGESVSRPFGFYKSEMIYNL